MEEEKNLEDVKRWKDMLAGHPGDAALDLKGMPQEVLDALVKDPEIGPELLEVITKALPEDKGAGAAATEDAAPVETERHEGSDAPDAPAEITHAHKESAAVTAIRARKEKEEREQKEEQARRLSLQAKIMRLDVGVRAKLARNGDKEVRSILIKDSNKQVSMAVLENPRITIQEIEVVAASRNVPEDMLREVGGHRDWCKSYTVIHGLVSNPKTPVGVSLTHLPKLKLNDLRMLAKSKGVPNVIRVSAKKLAQARTV